MDGYNECESPQARIKQHMPQGQLKSVKSHDGAR